jgi:hypothetical protein
MNQHQGIAPADARPHRRWAFWEIVLAYLILTAIASLSIWFIDQGAMHVANLSK